MVKVPDGSMRILVESSARAELQNFYIEDGVSKGEVNVVKESYSESTEIDALYKLAKSKFEKCLAKGLSVTPEIISPSIDIENPARLADIIVAQLDIDINEKYSILEEYDVNRRLEIVNARFCI